MIDPNDEDLPLMVVILKNLVKTQPVVVATPSSGEIKLLEIIKVNTKHMIFARAAGKEFAGKRYFVIETKGEEFYSWSKDPRKSSELGIGHGSVHLPIAANDEALDDFVLQKAKMFTDQPPMFLFCTKATWRKLGLEKT